jgi:hypothetical protein
MYRIYFYMCNVHMCLCKFYKQNHRSEILEPRLPGVFWNVYDLLLQLDCPVYFETHMVYYCSWPVYFETCVIYYCSWIAQCILKHVWFIIAVWLPSAFWNMYDLLLLLLLPLLDSKTTNVCKMVDQLFDKLMSRKAVKFIIILMVTENACIICDKTVYV